MRSPISVIEPAMLALPCGRAELRTIRETWDVQVELTRDDAPVRFWSVVARGRETGCVVVASGPEIRSLGAARRRARQLAEALGGHIEGGRLVVEVA